MNRYIYTYIVIFWSFTLSLSVFTACNSDILDTPGYVKEGEPATVNLKIDLDKISVKTRADMNSDLENRVECLWLAIYNVQTGERTFCKSYTPGSNFPEIENQYGTIKDIKTQSGNSYIVAVANYKTAIAIDLGNNGADKDNEQGLETLLANANTWEKYRAIAIKQRTDGENISIEVPAEAIVMQGSYRESGHTDDYTEDETDAETVSIQPGVNNLDGIIHLRRIWTQNNITIQPGGDIISMELVNMEVVNAPMLTWLYGRQQNNDGGTLGYANAGDAYDPDMQEGPEHPMYRKSMTYTPTSMTVTTDGEGRHSYTFDYWQYENKRNSQTALTYADREKEKKNADETNSGIYTSLCPNGKAMLDNNATYIRFTAKIKYLEGKDITNPDELKDAIGKVKYRNAEATYVVHLGYIGDNPKDFNCYRNSKYIYNITVKSVNQILLEAFNVGENQPGAEGIVTDVTDEFFDLDAHFNVFNIYLTQQDLEEFTFSMTTYEDNIPHTIYCLKDDNNVPKKGTPDWKYYSWIQLIKNGTTAGTTQIAKFPELNNDGTPKNNDEEVLYLKDIQGKASQMIDELKKENKNGYCFTVYVKEYTYEADFGESDYGNENIDLRWTHYVNQPSRIANFNVRNSISSDMESQYFSSKYALSQRSIQTYYDITKATTGINGTALGVEHINEVFGMNIRWTTGDKNFDRDNGRYNIWLALGGSNGSQNCTATWENEKILDLENLLKVNKADNKAQTTNAKHLNFEGGTRYVPAMKCIIPANNLSGDGSYFNSLAGPYDPQTNEASAQYIEAIYSCMNRNKDENGNGKIDAPELKWYVPSSGKYLRIILGRNNLVTPLMGYEQETLPFACGTGQNTLYHFISSDRKIIWADEGLSSSWFDSRSQWQMSPWQVRCIRNLGTNLNEVSSSEKVIAAYDDKGVDSSTKGGVIKPTRYFGGALRNPTTLPIPPHKTSSPYNRLARYGFEIAPAGNGNTTDYNREAGMQTISYDDTGTIPQSVSTIGGTYSAITQAINTASPCEKLNKSSGRKGWRIPNQKEVVIIMRAGVVHTSGYYNYSINGTGADAKLSASESGWNTGAPGMMCSTQEHWPGINESEGTLSGSVNASDALSYSNRWTTIETSSSLATAKLHSQMRAVRCVRDLTAEEANMTYEEIKNHKTN